MQTNHNQPADAAGVFNIWPGTGVPPGAEEWDWHEQSMAAPGSDPPTELVRNVVIPTLTLFKPAVAKANGTAMIIAPGGAFHFLMVDRAGYMAARWLAELGVTAFVLKYRVQHTPEADEEMPAFLAEMRQQTPPVSRTENDPPRRFRPAEEARLWGEADGRQALRYVRQHAAEWGVDPRRLGIMGFSAGGGVAVNAALESDALSRPDFVAGIYPAYRMVTPFPDDLPPLFLLITDDDGAVSPISAARLYEAWRRTGQVVELHIFAQGGHGFGMHKQDRPVDGWTELFEQWLAAQGYA